jgi:hypothetical protein
MLLSRISRDVGRWLYVAGIPCALIGRAVNRAQRVPELRLSVVAPRTCAVVSPLSVWISVRVRSSRSCAAYLLQYRTDRNVGSQDLMSVLMSRRTNSVRAGSIDAALALRARACSTPCMRYHALSVRIFQACWPVRISMHGSSTARQLLIRHAVRARSVGCPVRSNRPRLCRAPCAYPYALRRDARSSVGRNPYAQSGARSVPCCPVRGYPVRISVRA